MRRLARLFAPPGGDERPWVFAGHSDFVAGLAGYDMKAPLTGTAPGEIPDAGLAAEAGLAGGLFEVMVPPVVRLQVTGTPEGMEIEYPPRLDRSYALDRDIAGIDIYDGMPHAFHATALPVATTPVRRVTEWIDRRPARGEDRAE